MRQHGRYAVRAATLGIGAVVALVLAGCHGEHDTSVPPPTTGVSDTSTGTTSSSASATSATSAPPASGTSGGVKHTPVAQRTPVASKQLAPGSSGVFTTDGGRALGIVVEKKGCEKVDARLAEQTTQRVVMVVTTKDISKPGAMCPMHIANVPVTVTLDAPLGDRTVRVEQQH